MLSGFALVMTIDAITRTTRRAAHDDRIGQHTIPGARAIARRRTQVLPALRSAPLATAMVLLLLIAALELHARPGDTSGLVAWASTNLHNLARHPVASMLVSPFVVPSGLLPELGVLAVASAFLERAVGTRRTAAIALSGHVLATLRRIEGDDGGIPRHHRGPARHRTSDRRRAEHGWAKRPTVPAETLLAEGSDVEIVERAVDKVLDSRADTPNPISVRSRV